MGTRALAATSFPTLQSPPPAETTYRPDQNPEPQTGTPGTHTGSERRPSRHSYQPLL